MSTTINLRDYYPWYTHDEFTEVSDEVAAELLADKRYQKAQERQMYRYKAQYSLDAGDGIEASAIACHNNSPEAVLEMMERHCGLCWALNSLPEIQGRRIEAHYIFGKTHKEIARAEGVSEEAVSKAIDKGLAAMKKYLKKFQQGG
jgi:RNA polymerase sigma-70 factor (ECF subfamily)